MNPRRRRKLRLAHRARRRRARNVAFLRETGKMVRTLLTVGEFLRPFVNEIMRRVLPPVHLRAPAEGPSLTSRLYAP